MFGIAGARPASLLPSAFFLLPSSFLATLLAFPYSYSHVSTSTRRKARGHFWSSQQALYRLGHCPSVASGRSQARFHLPRRAAQGERGGIGRHLRERHV